MQLPGVRVEPLTVDRVVEKEEIPKHKHDWSNFKRPIRARSPQYTGGQMFFLVRKCSICDEESVYDMVSSETD